MSGTIVTGTPGTAGLPELAAAKACERCGPAGEAPTAVVVELARGRPRAATVVATAAAKDLERRLRDGEELPEGAEARARGRVVFVAVPEGASGAVAGLIELLADEAPLTVVAPASRFREVLELDHPWAEVLIRADGPRGVSSQEAERESESDPDPDPLLRLVVDEIEAKGIKVQLVPKAPGRLVGRLALAGRAPSGKAARSPSAELGQATPLALGGVFVLVLGAIALVAISGAITGKARGQRNVDLSALSAARSMKDDLPRLMAPPTLPNGAPNPYHMPKPLYLARARLAAVRIATVNGASPAAVSVRFPDRSSWAPVRARVAIRTVVTAREHGAAHRAPPVWAEARVSAPAMMGAVPAMATGGGYSGPLASRQGKGMRPDVAVAFDRMAAAARAAGVTLVINSGFRSDAEQASLFAANPDPRMVARPGTSLHRCGTELDLGPPSAYGWLAANAGRFGFLQRYSWEPWHYGWDRPPAPCSAAGDRAGVPGAAGGAGGVGRGDRSQALPASLPAFVPARYRRAILRSAMRWNVSAALLAAQLYAESGFDPRVVSSAGAMGIAQFMPGTAASYGLRDPFDPEAAIDAQGHLMSDLLRQFRSPALALAAYNAGPGAVSPCNCIPPYAETQAYVAKIMAMLAGIGAIGPMPMEIELVR